MKKVLIRLLVFAIDLIVCFGVLKNFTAYIVPSGLWLNIVDGDSMHPALEDGTFLFSDDIDEINRGDIVTLVVPDTVNEAYLDHAGEIIIKRVIGKPGETIVIDETGVYVNNKKINEEYLTEESREYTYKEAPYNSVQLGEDEYYVMGDNREISFDSRLFGTVTLDNLIAKQSEVPTKFFCLKSVMMVAVIIVIVIFWYSIEKILLRVFKYH